MSMPLALVWDLIAVDKASPVFNRVSRNANVAATGMDRAVTRFNAGAKKMQETGTALTHRVTVPLAAIGVVSGKMATDFNSAMTRIQTQAGGSAKDVKVLSNQVLGLAKYAQQGPVELANALYHLKSVGMDNVTAMKAERQAVDLAAVGHANLEDTTNALAGAWRTGIKGAKNFHDAVRTLNAIIGAGNMTMEDLNAALGTGILPTAKTFGLTLKDVGSALALFTDEGVPAQQAATRLRMSFSLLGAPSAAAEKQLKKIGLTGLDLANDMRKPNGLIHAIGDLKAHLTDPKYKLSLSQQAQLLSHAFGGGRSSSAILSMINNFDVLKKKQDQVTKSLGKYDQAVKAQRNTPEAKFKLLESSLQRSAILLGNQVLPLATSASNEIGDIAEKFNGLSGGQKKLIVYAGLALAALGPLLSIGGRVGKVFALMWRNWSAGTVAMRTVGTTARTVGTTMQTTATQMDMASLKVRAAQLSEQSAAERAAATIAVSEANKAKAAATAADEIAAALKGTDSLLAADADAAARNARAYSAAMQQRADAAVRSAAQVSASSVRATQALGRQQALARRMSRSQALRGAGFAGSLGFVIGSQYAASAIGGKGDTVRGATSGVLSSAGQGAGAGLFFGPYGAAAGATVGAVAGAVRNPLIGGIMKSGIDTAMGQTVSGGLVKFAGVVKDDAAAIRLFTKALEQGGPSMKQNLSTVARAALSQGSLTAAAKKSGLTQKDLTNAITGTNTEYLRTLTVLKNSGTATEFDTNSLKRLREEYLRGQGAAAQYALATGRALPSFMKSGTLAQLLEGKLVKLTRVHISAKKAAKQFGASLRSLTANVTQNGKSLDRTTLFGQRNAVAVRQAASAALAHAQAVYKRTDSLKQAQRALISDRNRILDDAAAAGLNKQQVNQLITSMGIFGKMRPNAKITVDARSAKADLNDVITKMHTIGRGASAVINVTTINTRTGGRNTVKMQAAGTVAAFGRATIPPNTRFTVGEAGFEGGVTDSLGRATIFSHAQSKAMGFRPPRGYANGTVSMPQPKISAPAVRTSASSRPVNVRVFIGDEEIRDMVRVEMDAEFDYRERVGK